MTLKTYENLEQGSEQWLEARRGLVTASTVGQLIESKPPSALDYACSQCGAEPGNPCMSVAKKDPAPIKVPHSPRSTLAAENPDNLPSRLTVADNETSRALTALLVAERINGWSDPTFFSADMQRGHDVEPVAREWYAEKNGVEVTQLGFMVRALHAGERLGYSPDGIVGDDGLLEVKAPRSKTHLLTHLSGEVPERHLAQIQAGLYVSGRDWCDYVSFYGGMPPFQKRVHADRRWFAAITAAVRHFEAEASEMRAEYESRTTGLPRTERLLFDMEIF